MSFEKAVEAGGEGLETDVTIRCVIILIFFLSHSFIYGACELHTVMSLL